jgi:hypothetical protein
MKQFLDFFRSLFRVLAEKDEYQTTILYDPQPPKATTYTVPQVVDVPNLVIPLTKKDMLEIFCTAIRDFEGKPGDMNYRNNNPGNFRCSPVGYLAKYGNVKCVNGFARFPSYELGWLYLKESVKQRAKKHPNWTIRDFFHNYAPPSDNNPTEAYARNVAKKCGVLVDTTLAKLFS